ncbi:MAG: PH domain-containing protein [Candidatus Campbellbacteria bacterium]|nr:PH domain-containing protein [Candidatus Campbellbacteria bacterium]
MDKFENTGGMTQAELKKTVGLFSEKLRDGEEIKWVGKSYNLLLRIKSVFSLFVMVGIFFWLEGNTYLGVILNLSTPGLSWFVDTNNLEGAVEISFLGAFLIAAIPVAFYNLFLFFKTTRYAITNKRFLIRYTRYFLYSYNISDIREMKIDQGAFGHLIGSGTLSIDTGKFLQMSDEDGYKKNQYIKKWQKLKGIKNPYFVRELMERPSTLNEQAVFLEKKITRLEKELGKKPDYSLLMRNAQHTDNMSPGEAKKVVALFSEKLRDGEEVKWVGKPYGPIAFIKMVGRTIVGVPIYLFIAIIVATIIYGEGMWSSSSSEPLSALFIIVLIIIFSIIIFVFFVYPVYLFIHFSLIRLIVSRYVITNKRLFMKNGWFDCNTHRLSRIPEVKLYTGYFSSKLKCGDIDINVEWMKKGSKFYYKTRSRKMFGIRNPESVKNLLEQCIKESKRKVTQSEIDALQRRATELEVELSSKRK